MTIFLHLVTHPFFEKADSKNRRARAYRPMKKEAIYILLLGMSQQSAALTFSLPMHGDIVGSVQTIRVDGGESFGEIGRRYDVGIYELIEANPGVNPWSPRRGTKLTIPTKFVLPAGSRSGMIINLAEMRLYFYHKNGQVSTHPIGIGRKGWQTPLGASKIIQKTKNPTWRPPKSIIENHRQKGEYLPAVVPPGPDNPLGKFAMRLSMPGYLIHGTNRPGGIGVRSSSGCIRMFPRDIENLFDKIPLGTSVRIIHEPFKLGYNQGKLYLEAHEPLSDEYYNKKDLKTKFIETLRQAKIKQTDFDWMLAEDIIQQASGLPVRLN